MRDTATTLQSRLGHAYWLAAESLVRRVRRVGGSNLHSCLRERLRNLLRQQLGLFSPDPGVGMSFEKLANGRGDDGVHLVQIIHLIHTKLPTD